MKDILIKAMAGILGGIIRHILTTLGGAGVVTGAAGEAVNPELLGGGIAAIVVGIGWSLWEKARKSNLSVEPSTKEKQ